MSLLGSLGAYAATAIDTNQPFYLESQVGTTVNPDFQGGTLRDDRNNVTDSDSFTVENFPTNTIDAFGHSTTFSGTFTGTGPLTITDSVGGGTVIVTNAGSSTGGALTINSSATMQWGDGTNVGVITTPSIVDNGTLIIDAGSGNGTALCSCQLFSGTGNVRVESGFLEIDGATYSGATTIDSGASLRLGGPGSLTNTSGVLDNGTLDISGTAAGTSITTLSGSGTVSLGGRALTLVNASGTFSGVIADGGVFGGTSGSLVIAGGTETLTGANTYSGGTTLNGGTLAVTNNSALGTGAINLNGGTLLANSTVTLSNTINFTPPSQVIVAAAAGQTLTLAGPPIIDPGPSATVQFGDATHTGTVVFPPIVCAQCAIALINNPSRFVVAGGTLVVNSSIGPITVDSGATLSGAGTTLGAMTINSGGTLAPGASGKGTLTLYGGNLSLAPGSNYSVFTTPTVSSLALVNESADLGGTIIVTPGGSYTLGEKIDVLTALGGVNGTFSTLDVNGSFGDGLRAVLGYDPNDAYITIVPASVSQLLPAGTPRNVTNIAGAIDNALLNDNAFNTFAPLFNLSSSDLENTLSHMTGEAGADASQSAFGLNTSFLNVLMGEFGDSAGLSELFGSNDARRTEVAYEGAPDATPLGEASSFSVWSTGYGGWSNLDGNEDGLGTHGFRSAQGGLAVGFNDHLSVETNFGGAVGYGHSGWWAKDGMGSGTANAVQFGLYGDQRIDAFSLSLAADYAHYWTSTADGVILGGVNEYRGQFGAQSEAVRGEIARRIAVDDAVWIAPYLTGEAQWYQNPAYSQSVLAGVSGFALSYAGATQSDITHDLGIETNWTLRPDAEHSFDLDLQAGWLHEYDGIVSEQASFGSFANTAFTTFGTRGPRNAARLSLGGTQSISDALTLRLMLDSVLSGTAQSYNGFATLAYRL